MLTVALALVAGVVAGQNENAQARLYDDLFEDMNYNQDVIPLTGGEPVQLELGLTLTSIDMVGHGELAGTGWVKMRWTDFRLTWDPEQYNGLQILRVPGARVWMPDVEVYNSASWVDNSFHAAFAKKDFNALIYPNGTVLYIPALPLRVNCHLADVTLPESAPQDCLIRLGSWTFDGTAVALSLYDDKDRLDLGEFTNSPWVVTKQEPNVLKAVKYEGFDDTYYNLSFQFTMQKAYVPVPGGEGLMENSALPMPLADIYTSYESEKDVVTEL